MQFLARSCPGYVMGMRVQPGLKATRGLWGGGWSELTFSSKSASFSMSPGMATGNRLSSGIHVRSLASTDSVCEKCYCFERDRRLIPPGEDTERHHISCRPDAGLMKQNKAPSMSFFESYTDAAPGTAERIKEVLSEALCIALDNPGSRVPATTPPADPPPRSRTWGP